MMFIKTVFALYFAVITIAAAQDSTIIDTGDGIGTSCLNPCPLSTSLIKPT
jgi:hypothetical protein